jgi:hypothetical protein
MAVGSLMPNSRVRERVAAAGVDIGQQHRGQLRSTCKSWPVVPSRWNTPWT